MTYRRPQVKIEGMPYREYAACWGSTTTQGDAELYNWSSPGHKPNYGALLGALESLIEWASKTSDDPADVAHLMVLRSLAEWERDRR